MIDKVAKGRIINQLVKEIKSRDIDVFVIITSEGSDSMTGFIPGVGTVGMGAFLFTKDNKRYSITTSIDVQDIEETELFTECIKYSDFAQSFHDLWKQIAPRRAIFDYSEDDVFCDGLTVGRFQRMKNAVADLPPFEIMSSSEVIEAVRRETAGV